MLRTTAVRQIPATASSSVWSAASCSLLHTSSLTASSPSSSSSSSSTSSSPPLALHSRPSTQPGSNKARQARRGLATVPDEPSSSSRSRLSALREKLAQESDEAQALASSPLPPPGQRVAFGRTGATRLPSYLKTSIPTGDSFKQIKKDLRGLGLSTVCEEARCPNIGECWGGAEGKEGAKEKATATIMLMGDTCTRACRFCSVKTSRRPGALDPHEPENTAEAIRRWGLGYIVLTSVDRDDLVDGGSHHIAETISKIKSKAPSTLVEALVPDFSGNFEDVDRVARSGLDVFAHNIETVERTTPTVRDRRAKYRQTLSVLARAKEARPSLVTKTSIMLGCGEEDHEVEQTLQDLRAHGVDVVTLGQYMRPTKRHMAVSAYVAPEKFEHWKQRAEALGFLYVASGPLVRSSYRAGEFFIENVLKKRKAQSLLAQAVDEPATSATASLTASS